jgi:hypothetical protein
MRVLLLNPIDSPFDGPWAAESWDMVVDLGWAGACRYEEWAATFRCPVYGFFNFGEEIEDVRKITEALQVGRGKLIDDEGIDWWDLMAPAKYPQLHEYLILQHLVSKIPPEAEIRGTRPHRLFGAIERLRGSAIESYLAEPTGKVRRYVKAARRLTLQQIWQVAMDKWDTDYGIRRFARPARKEREGPLVLLPSSYINVSRVLSAYAGGLPERRFLLVTTRPNGELKVLPPNLDAAPLQSYAPIPKIAATGKEISRLETAWTRLNRELLGSDEWYLPIEMGCYEIFPTWLRTGLRVRDAWRRVLEREPIEAVLCGDENNFFNRLPVLLARNRKLPTVSCSHGALDSNTILREIGSNVYLARGEMEKDYLLGKCAVAREKVTVGAPDSFARASKIKAGERDQVVLFSEPYELYSGRVELFYSEVLPPLASAARTLGKTVTIKLHPFENLAERKSIANRVLPQDLQGSVRLTDEPLTDGFLDHTLFALTVESSVAVDCALRGVPCFLCGWYELGLYGYGDQYEKFGAAIKMRGPKEISDIPARLASGNLRKADPGQLVRTIEPSRLESYLHGTSMAEAAVEQ